VRLQLINVRYVVGGRRRSGVVLTKELDMFEADPAYKKTCVVAASCCEADPA
jgi:hypothetical protein